MTLLRILPDDAPPPARQKRPRSPESMAWDNLKGRDVHIEWPDNRRFLIAKLLWVDHFSVGIQRGGLETILLKQPGMTFSLAPTK